MPRTSLESLAILRVNGQPARLKPPDTLSPDEAAVFSATVAACDARHFTPADLPLLCRYAEADMLAQRAARELRRGPVAGGKVNPWLTVQEKSVRALVSLSLRLRICPQARQDPKTAARRALGPRPSVYDTMGGLPDE